MTTSFETQADARSGGPARRRGDGRFGFAVAAAGSLLALLAVVERAGLSVPVLRILALIAGALALVGIGGAMRTMRVSTFYAAGHALAPRHAGLALAGLGLALLLPLAPPAGGQIATAGLVAGFMCGLAGAALIGGPLLRKAGASSLADYVCLRFSHGAVRTTTGLLAAVVGLSIALAGLTAASGELMAFAGLSRPAAAALAGCLALALLLPGGLAGSLWGAAAATVLPLAILALSLVVGRRTAAGGRRRAVGGDAGDARRPKPRPPGAIGAARSSCRPLALGIARRGAAFRAGRRVPKPRRRPTRRRRGAACGPSSPSRWRASRRSRPPSSSPAASRRPTAISLYAGFAAARRRCRSR